MSSGGMEWAYRMMAAHDLDPLGAMIVLHLGWRDAPSQRTDKGIARATCQHVSSVRKATAKLSALGVIVRRSGQWIAAETVAIVMEAPDARRPDAASADEGVPLSGTCHSVARGVPLSGTAKRHSVAPKRKENIEKGARAARPRSAAHSPAPRNAASRAASGRAKAKGANPPNAGATCDPAALSPFQRAQLETGQAVLIGGELVAPRTLDAVLWLARLREESGGAGTRGAE